MDNYVFGLDIGTRSIVGTVGYRQGGDRFVVVAQVSIEHETRAVIDGQIHDIPTVASTIGQIKEQLEEMVGRPLTEVCIAAAGRVLKTKRVRVDYSFPNETKVMEEHIRSLDMLGVERAYELIRKDQQEENTQYYCVGYATAGYFLNDYPMSLIELHKAKKIGVDLIATFLPDEVVDGLYSAVETAGLAVANLTLEPIAAINVAIPENFRLLNIALVDVGAGTSDISVVKDGSIIAFGMMPLAGDEVTETIAKAYLVDFQTAEKIKRQATTRKNISFKNIMGEMNKITADEVRGVTEQSVHGITHDIAEKIVELNGGKNVSAVFVVGGGGKFSGFVQSLAHFLHLPENRVAIRGAEVLQKVEFLQKDIKKDSTLVTPIGICLNYYEQKNNFIHVQVNENSVKLYDNNKLTLLDAAIGYGFSQESLFPGRGEPIHYQLNGTKCQAKGNLGEAAVIMLNGETVSLNAAIKEKDIIEIQPATKGGPAKVKVGDLEECKGEITFSCLGKTVICPKLLLVNNEEVSSLHIIKDKDKVVVKDHYTLEQVIDYLGLDPSKKYQLNGTLCQSSDMVGQDDVVLYWENENPVENEKTEDKDVPKTDSIDEWVNINGESVKLEPKEHHILVDVFDVYPFDLSKAGGHILITRVNGVDADFTTPITSGDKIELTWRD